MLDVTWEAPDGSITPLHGYLDSYLQQVYLAGAFGNYVTRISAHKIGLLKGPLERVVPAGNTALLGAKRALFEAVEGWDTLSQMVEHVSLNEDPAFQDIFAEEIGFPQ